MNLYLKFDAQEAQSSKLGCLILENTRNLMLVLARYWDTGRVIIAQISELSANMFTTSFKELELTLNKHRLLDELTNNSQRCTFY